MINLLWLLTAHCIGDFFCQSDRMAIGKSKSWATLTQHVAIYSAVMTLGAAMVDLPSAVTFGVWTFGTHFATDAVTSRIASRLWFLEMQPFKDPGGRFTHFARAIPGNRHWFFCAIGVDQLIHAWTIALTARLVGIL